MDQIDYHFFICGSFRTNGSPQGICYKKEALDLIQYLENEIIDRGIENACVSSTGCLKRCEKGPIMVIYPKGAWYGDLSEKAIDEILDSLEAGTYKNEYYLE